MMQESRLETATSSLWLDSNQPNLGLIEEKVQSAFGSTWERGVFGVKVQVLDHVANVKIYLLDHSADDFVEESMQLLTKELESEFDIVRQPVYGIVPCQKVAAELVA